MKKLFVAIILLFSLLFFEFVTIQSNDFKKKYPENKFTLIELFTSEGCSSCPPAETIFNDLVQKNNPNLIAIAFHVDYWDRLGWKDSFSNKEWTNRQVEYRDYFKNESIYTPQLIVNGTQEFVGSNKIKVSNSLLNKIKIENDINLTTNTKRSELIIDYSISGKLDHKNLVLILIQKQAEVFVKRGENSGKKLLHTNIARDLIEIDLKNNSGQTQLEIPSELSEKDFFIIGFIQNKTSKIISGVTKV